MLAQVCTVLGLEGTQFVDLALEQCTLLIQLRKNVLVLVLCVSNNFVALRVCVGDDAIGFFAAIANVLVVDALRQCKHRGCRFCTLGSNSNCGGCNGGLGDGRLGGNGLFNDGSSGLFCRLVAGGFATGQLSDTTLSSLKLFAQVLVLSLESIDRGNDLIEEVVNLDLVISFTELHNVEGFFQHIFGCEQSHLFTSRYLLCDARMLASPDHR